MDLSKKLEMELESLRLAIALPMIQQMLKKDFTEAHERMPEALQQLQAVATFARRSAEVFAELQNPPQQAAEGVEGGRTLGVHAAVGFPMFNKQVEGKVDTGATTSSLHATNIKAQGGRVSFQSEMLSQNIITLPTEGTQEVHSADFGGDKRPIVRMDIEIDGVPLKGVMFNLNDRSQMDSKLLIGQDVLKAGNFTVDVNQGTETAKPEPTPERMPESVQIDETKIYEAIKMLADSNMTMKEFVKYLQTEAVSRIKD
jgi:hypothetical protein